MTALPPQRTRIKICGLTLEADLDAAVQAGADALGFVLYEGSPRCVSVARAAELCRRLPPFVTPVLLLVNASAAVVQAALDAVPHAVLQFHGDESAQACESAGRAYLKAVRMEAGVNLPELVQQFGRAQGLLLDACGPGYGGHGQVFDWSRLPASLDMPWVLAGGLSADNVGEAIARLQPWGVDVSSGVERQKGIKDAARMRAFCQAVRDADRLREAR